MPMASKKVLVTGGSGFIGIHLIELLLKQDYTVLNLDIRMPINNQNLDQFKNVSLTDKNQVAEEVLKFNPNFIIHLAATTTQNAKSLVEFEVNIKGTRNLLEVADNLDSLRKVIFTSSQYVNSPGYPYSTNSRDLHPYGFYGQSKLLGEEMMELLLQNSSWMIIRPTTIWGPWHPILTDGLWMQIFNGKYFHPKGDKAIKAYGYVKNTAWQILRLLEMESAYTDKKVFYIGDENIRQVKWVSAFVHRLTNQKMREIPKFVLLVASEIGELLTKLGVKFPLYRSRYRNLVTSNPSPLEETLLLLGESPITFEKAVDETCSWLEQVYSSSKLVD